MNPILTLENYKASGFAKRDVQICIEDAIFPAGCSMEADRVAIANDSLFNQSFFSRPLTTYALGYVDRSDLESDLDFYAPRVPVDRRFEYESWDNAEEFFSETTDDLRAIRGDFKRVEYTSKKINAKTENRGLTMRIDLDEVADKANWQERYTEKLIRRLRRNALRRALALYNSVATNTAKTWDTSAGKDPDSDVMNEIVLAGDQSGVRPNRVGYGDTAWTKRMLSSRSQSSAGGFASAMWTDAELAQFLGVEKIHKTSARFQASASTKSAVVGNGVFMFHAVDGEDSEDPSNMKRFVSKTSSGGDYAVYLMPVSSKLYDLTVEHYELLKMTSLLGVRKFTVS